MATMSKGVEHHHMVAGNLPGSHACAMGADGLCPCDPPRTGAGAAVFLILAIPGGTAVWIWLISLLLGAL